MTTEQHSGPRSRWNPRTIIAFIGFAAVAAFYLWTDHRAHLIGALPFLPYLIFLACPLMHLFMHRGHGGHGEKAATPAPEKPVEPAEHRGHGVAGGTQSGGTQL